MEYLLGIFFRESGSKSCSPFDGKRICSTKSKTIGGKSCAIQRYSSSLGVNGEHREPRIRKQSVLHNFMFISSYGIVGEKIWKKRWRDSKHGIHAREYQQYDHVRRLGRGCRTFGLTLLRGIQTKNNANANAVVHIYEDPARLSITAKQKSND
jgi:hypothetical protein